MQKLHQPGEGIALVAFVAGLMQDLEELRAGKLNCKDARTRAELAKQALRGLELMLVAEKYLEGQAHPVASVTHDQN